MISVAAQFDLVLMSFALAGLEMTSSVASRKTFRMKCVPAWTGQRQWFQVCV